MSATTGQTLDKVVGNLGTREFNAGLTYVFFSRVRHIILDPFPGHASSEDAVEASEETPVNVAAYWERIEFQSRGMAHCHEVFWHGNPLPGTFHDKATTE